MFRSSIRQKTVRGLEAGCLGFADLDNETAVYGIAVQIPSPNLLKQVGKTLVNHNVSALEKYLMHIVAIARYMAVDGYFIKKDLTGALRQKEMHITTNFYKCVQRSGKGRPLLYDKKLNVADLKMWHTNQLITKRIFSNLDVDMRCRKIKRIYNHCMNLVRRRT